MPPFLPFPKDVEGECKRAARYLYKVAQPAEFQGVVSKVSEKTTIPPNILKNAKGIAVFKVLKGGFIWSGRMGAGLAVARLPDGRWSAPATYGLLGVGVGGQIGGQMTYLVLILNTEGAVTAFKTPGNLTLGADIAIAAGPVGRDASVNGAVYGFAPIFSYSKSAGLFAGVSLEGTVIIGRRDADSKFYGRKITASEILTGKVEPPMAAKPLYEAIAKITEGDLGDISDSDDESGKREYDLKNSPTNYSNSKEYETYKPDRTSSRDSDDRSSSSLSRAAGAAAGYMAASRGGGSSTEPYEQAYDAYNAYNAATSSRSGSMKRPPAQPPAPYKPPASRGYEEEHPAPPPAYSAPTDRSAVSNTGYGSKPYSSSSNTSTGRRDDLYGPPSSGGRRDDLYGAPSSSSAKPASSYKAPSPVVAASPASGEIKKKPPPPPPKKPEALRQKEMVMALYPFEAVQPGDLELEMGELYEVLEKTPSADGWWKGRSKDGREGLFPGNYVKPA